MSNIIKTLKINPTPTDSTVLFKMPHNKFIASPNTTVSYIIRKNGYQDYVGNATMGSDGNVSVNVELVEDTDVVTFDAYFYQGPTTVNISAPFSGNYPFLSEEKIIIDWGDGEQSIITDGVFEGHTYTATGSYIITITVPHNKCPIFVNSWVSIEYINATSPLPRMHDTSGNPIIAWDDVGTSGNNYINPVLPFGFFKNNPQITSLKNFQSRDNTTSNTHLPEDLYWYFTGDSLDITNNFQRIYSFDNYTLYFQAKHIIANGWNSRETGAMTFYLPQGATLETDQSDISVQYYDPTTFIPPWETQ